MAPTTTTRSLSPPARGHIRLATSSPASGATTPATLAHLRALARRAATSHHADVLLLPEAYVGGYPRGSAFGCVVGQRTAQGREEFLRYWEQAVDLGDVVGEGAGGGEDWVARRLPGDDVGLVGGGGGGGGERRGGEEEEKKNRRGDGTREVLEEIAAESGVFLVTGLIEKAGGSLYCAVVYVCPQRGMIGKRRKVLPTGSERLIWAQGSPRTLQAVSTVIRGVRVNMAAAICWENYMPLLRQALYAQNINLYLAPTADGRDAWLGLMRTVGVEGRCFVVSSNMCVREGAAAAAAAATTTTNSSSEEEEDQQEVKGDAPPYYEEGGPHKRNTGGRRNSAITEDGFEIALPKAKKIESDVTTSPPPPPAAAAPAAATATISADGRQQRRRKSIMDENGNEIVLHCDDAGFGTMEVNNIPGDITSPSSSATPITTTTALNGQTQSSSAAAAAAAAAVAPAAGPKPTKFISRGGSCITNPFGDVLAGPSWEDDDEIIYADVDFKDCIRARLDSDAAGSYSRNDSFKFSVQGLTLTPLPY